MSIYKEFDLPISIKIFLTSGLNRVLLILGLVLFLWIAIFWVSVLP